MKHRRSVSSALFTFIVWFGHLATPTFADDIVKILFNEGGEYLPTRPTAPPSPQEDKISLILIKIRPGYTVYTFESIPLSNPISEQFYIR
jgi:hypothetical protein